MRKDEIVIGAAHAVALGVNEVGRGRAEGAPVVKVKALAVGQPRPHSRRADGVLVGLLEPYRTSVYVDGDYHDREWPIGHELVVAAKVVMGPWTEEDEQITLARATRYETHDRVRALLARLGLDPHMRRRELADDAEGGRPAWVTHEVLGYSIAGRHVTIDLPAFEAWLGRIDPVVIAEQALGLYVEALERRHVGLAEWEYAAAREETLQEIREGAAVADSELRVSEDG